MKRLLALLMATLLLVTCFAMASCDNETATAESSEAGKEEIPEDKTLVPTLDDTFDFTIPEGTQSGQVFTIRGKGIKSARGGTGNLILKVFVEVPTKITRDQKRKIEALYDDVELKQYDKMKDYIMNIATEEELKEHFNWYKVNNENKIDLLNTMFESYCNNYNNKELEERINDLFL